MAILGVKKSYWIWGGVILLLGAMFYYASRPSSNSIDGVECSPMEFATYHIHAHLDLFINGKSVPVPANIGTFPSCLYWLHTHAPDGIIHVEAPTKRDFTLGQFFDIWNKSYGSPLNGVDTSSLWLTVNGQNYTGDYRELVFGSHQVIVMQFGTPYTAPKEYVFAPGT